MPHRMLIAAALLAGVTLAPLALAAGTSVQVQDVWARRAPMLKGMDPKMGTGNTAVYATIVNQGSKPDQLLSASSDDARMVEVHESYQEQGMMMMRPVAKVDVPAGGKVELKPGSYHLMAIDLKRDLKAGEAMKLKLHFRDAGEVPVTAQVR